MSATALKRTYLPLLSCELIKRNFFLVDLIQHPLGYVLQNRYFQKFTKTYKKSSLPEFLSDKFVHHQACNFIKKRLQLRCFTVNFAKLFSAPLSVSHFNTTFLTLNLRRTYIYIFQALLAFRYFSATSCSL